MLFSCWVKIKSAVLDILFPPICLVCDRTFDSKDIPENICDGCFKNITIHETMFCAVCGARLPRNAKICHKDAPATLAAATTYDDTAVKKLIWILKYRKALAGAAPLAKILIAYIRELDADFSDFITVPVPLHKTRLRKRGFNQAELLAQKTSSALGIPFLNALTRVRDNPPQAKSKNKEERQKNIARCFALGDKNDIVGKKIILVDDVFTSGATTFEAARVLKSAGARKIIVLVVAKGG